jgi:hypothetical protein
MHAIRDIRFSGYANLETDAPSKQLEADKVVYAWASAAAFVADMNSAQLAAYG